MSESIRRCLTSQSRAKGRGTQATRTNAYQLPVDGFLWAAAGSMGLALGLQAAGRRRLGLFIGQWASPLLMLGLYNKLVDSVSVNREEGASAAKQWDREAAAETIVEPEAPWSSSDTPVMEDEELPPYREHIENEFGVHSVSDFPHDERFPSSPA